MVSRLHHGDRRDDTARRPPVDRLRFGIAGEEKLERPVACDDANGGEVLRLRPRKRGQDLDCQLAHGDGAFARGEDSAPRGFNRRQRAVETLGGCREAVLEHCAYSDGVKNLGESPDVIVVVVGDDNEIELLHTQESQCNSRDGLRFSCIDQYVAAVRAAEEDCVPLTNIKEVHEKTVGVGCGAAERDGKGLRGRRPERQQGCRSSAKQQERSLEHEGNLVPRPYLAHATLEALTPAVCSASGEQERSVRQSVAILALTNKSGLPATRIKARRSRRASRGLSCDLQSFVPSGVSVTNQPCAGYERAFARRRIKRPARM